jgi:hypothetical protein
MKPWMGRWVWIHNVSQEVALLDQAETIRQITSVQLWKEIEGKRIPSKVVPFPNGFQTPSWPQPADKHANS